MFASSTQKREWTFTREQLAEIREAANTASKAKWDGIVYPEEALSFLSADEESTFAQIVTEIGIKFGDAFQPAMWPSIRWTALMYFKRFFMRCSVMENSPKNVLMSCYYLAMKIDEFYVTIDDFVANLKSGTPQQNAARILSLEPEIMRVMKYHMTVHCPFRPFEGHLMEMKTRMLLLNFDLETIRPHAQHFFKRCLVGDVMLLFPPSQIALAGLKYGLDAMEKSPDVLREFLMKLLGVEDEWNRSGGTEAAHVQTLTNRLDDIIATMRSTSPEVSAEANAQLQTRMMTASALLGVLEDRKAASDPPQKRERNEFDDSDED